MRRAFAVVTVSVVLLLSIAIAPAGAQGRGGLGGSRGFNPAGGFQGFNPRGGFQGFNPRGGFQGFNPGPAARSMPPRFSKDGRFFPHQRSFVTGGYVIGAYGAPLYFDSTLGDSVVYDRPPTLHLRSTRLRPSMFPSSAMLCLPLPRAPA